MNIKDVMPPKPDKFYFYTGSYRLSLNKSWQIMSGTVGVKATDSPGDAYASVIMKWTELLAQQEWDNLTEKSQTENSLSDLKEQISIALSKFENIK